MFLNSRVSVARVLVRGQFLDSRNSIVKVPEKRQVP
jgi:hypothetical protein